MSRLVRRITQLFRPLLPEEKQQQLARDLATLDELELLRKKAAAYGEVVNSPVFQGLIANDYAKDLEQDLQRLLEQTATDPKYAMLTACIRIRETILGKPLVEHYQAMQRQDLLRQRQMESRGG